MERSSRVPIEGLQNAQRLLALVTSDERVAMGGSAPDDDNDS